MVNDKALKTSFAKVRADISNLQKSQQIIDGFARQTVQKVKHLEDQMQFLAELLRHMDRVGMTDGKSVIASKESNKAHARNCPYGKNIKSESKQFFNSIEDATSKGYEACECVV